jgi:hypothetical protein
LQQKIARLEAIRPNAAAVIDLLADGYLSNYKPGMTGA